VCSASPSAWEIYIQGMNTKTLTARRVPINDRLAAEFEQMRLRDSPVNNDSLVFGISEGSNIWVTFKRICAGAGLEGLRLQCAIFR